MAEVLVAFGGLGSLLVGVPLGLFARSACGPLKCFATTSACTAGGMLASFNEDKVGEQLARAGGIIGFFTLPLTTGSGVALATYGAKRAPVAFRKLLEHTQKRN